MSSSSIFHTPPQVRNYTSLHQSDSNEPNSATNLSNYSNYLSLNITSTSPLNSTTPLNRRLNSIFSSLKACKSNSFTSPIKGQNTILLDSSILNERNLSITTDCVTT